MHLVKDSPGERGAGTGRSRQRGCRPHQAQEGGCALGPHVHCPRQSKSHSTCLAGSCPITDLQAGRQGGANVARGGGWKTRETGGQGLTVLSSIGITKAPQTFVASRRPRPHTDPEHARALGKETSDCDRDPETVLMAPEATNQDKPNPNKDTVKPVDQTQWGKPYRMRAQL